MPPDARLFYDFGPFSLDPQTRILWRDGNPVELEPRVLKILVMLVKAKGDLVEKEDLIKQVWEDVAVTDDSLYGAITLLRKTLGPGLNGKAYIRTIPSRGYCFTITVVERWGDWREVSTEIPVSTSRPTAV